MSKFNNTKVKVKDAEESKLVQEAMFKEGFGWGKRKQILHTTESFLFFEEGFITYSTYQHTFEEKSFREVSVEEILGKLINENEMENLNEFDKKALMDAKKEIEQERAEAQKEKAKEILRDIMNTKDKAEEIIKSTTKRLEEIDESLTVFRKLKK